MPRAGWVLQEGNGQEESPPCEGISVLRPQSRLGGGIWLASGFALSPSWKMKCVPTPNSCRPCLAPASPSAPSELWLPPVPGEWLPFTNLGKLNPTQGRTLWVGGHKGGVSWQHSVQAEDCQLQGLDGGWAVGWARPWTECRGGTDRCSVPMGSAG